MDAEVLATMDKKVEKSFRKRLIENGMLPENLPPMFRVTGLFNACDKLKLFSHDQTQSKTPTSPARYSSTKRGGQRRLFSTPNPVFFIDSSTYFANRYSEFTELFNKSKYSRSIPKLNTEGERALTIDSFSEFGRIRKKLLSASRFIVKIDIARFFPSIYTHSIPWAVHGKTAAKVDRNTKSQTIHANKIDYLIRQAQDQQTVGIPVGPDTSRIISELISCGVDARFSAEAGSHVKAIRLVDDLYIGANTSQEAEKLLSQYKASLAHFELAVNETKTKIYSAVHDLDPFWPVSIRREFENFSSMGSSTKAAADLNAFFDEVIRIAVRENDDGIVKFALRKIDDLRLWGTFWEDIEPFLVKAAINFPHCLDYVARAVVWRNRTSEIDKSTWRTLCWAVIIQHTELGNDFEVLWTLWILKELKIKLSGGLAESIFKNCGPFAAIVVLDLQESNLLDRSLNPAVLLGNL